MKRKVIWVAPYPIELAKSDIKNRPMHSAPWVTALAQGLKTLVDLTIISTSSKIKKNESFSNNGITFHFIKTPSPLIDFLLLFNGTLINLRRFLFKNNFSEYDIVHFHGTEHQYAYAFKDVKIPKVISIQGLLHKSYIYNKEVNYNYFNWRILKKYEIREIKQHQNFICRTHWDKKSVVDLNEKAITFENWEPLRQEFFNDACSYNSNNLVYIGGLVTMKGIKEVLIMFKYLSEKQNKFTLTICGKGNIDKLKKLQDKYGVSKYADRIIYKGRLNADELLQLYKKSFCLIHPTYIDNSPNSVCEAQVAGLPVIASNVGGVSSLINHTKTGILVERYQTLEIAEWIIKLKENKDLYDVISSTSRRECRERHNEQSIINKTLTIYNAIIND